VTTVIPVAGACIFAAAMRAALLSLAVITLTARAADVCPFAWGAVSALAPTGAAAVSWGGDGLGAGLLADAPPPASTEPVGAEVEGVDDVGGVLGVVGGGDTTTGGGAGATTGGVTTGGITAGGWEIGAAAAIVMLNVAGPTLPPAPSEIVKVKLSAAEVPPLF